jgi:hypothetical protein
VGALTNPDVGRYVNRHFVSAFQKVATFEIRDGAKVGGNVASYFCTPDGRVLHAIAGPVDAGTFLREARWANETYQLGELGRPAAMRAFFRKAHLERLLHGHGIALPPPDGATAEVLELVLLENPHRARTNEEKVHLVLAAGALPRLEEVYQVVFERILNEKISTVPVRVDAR